jgi:hypothetical protein
MGDDFNLGSAIAKNAYRNQYIRRRLQAAVSWLSLLFVFLLTIRGDSPQIVNLEGQKI